MRFQNPGTECRATPERARERRQGSLPSTFDGAASSRGREGRCGMATSKKQRWRSRCLSRSGGTKRQDDFQQRRRRRQLHHGAHALSTAGRPWCFCSAEAWREFAANAAEEKGATVADGPPEVAATASSTVQLYSLNSCRLFSTMTRG